MENAVCPIDGRYSGKTKELGKYFSEEALIEYRIKIEIEYFIMLMGQIGDLSKSDEKNLRKIYENFSDAKAVKNKNCILNSNNIVY